MALNDIVERIEGDAKTEAEALIAEAERRAAEIVSEARARAEREHARTVERARAASAAESDTLRANARLAARDRELASRNEIVSRALAEVERALAELPDDRYAAFMAARIVDAAHGGERVLVAKADRERLAGLADRVAAVARDLTLEWTDEPASVERGVVLEGDRVRAELSLASAVAERRSELEAVVSETLFGTRDA